MSSRSRGLTLVVFLRATSLGFLPLEAIGLRPVRAGQQTANDPSRAPALDNAILPQDAALVGLRSVGSASGSGWRVLASVGVSLGRESVRWPRLGKIPSLTSPTPMGRILAVGVLHAATRHATGDRGGPAAMRIKSGYQEGVHTAVCVGPEWCDGSCLSLVSGPRRLAWASKPDAAQDAENLPLPSFRGSAATRNLAHRERICCGRQDSSSL